MSEKEKINDLDNSYQELRKNFNIKDNEKFDVHEDEEEIKTPKKKTTEKQIEKPKKTKEKQPFFQDLKDIFADNFVFAASSLKSAWLSVWFGGKTLSANKILILLFISIPAIFGGFSVFLAGLIVIILWLIYLLIRGTSDSVKKIEDTFFANIKSFKQKFKKNKFKPKHEKIVNLGLYSIAYMTNGLMYLVFKGIRIPIQGLSDITKYIGNIIDKIGEGLKDLGTLPSEMHLNNFKKKQPKRKLDRGLLKRQAKQIEKERKKAQEISLRKQERWKKRAQMRANQKTEKQRRTKIRNEAELKKQAELEKIKAAELKTKLQREQKLREKFQTEKLSKGKQADLLKEAKVEPNIPEKPIQQEIPLDETPASDRMMDGAEREPKLNKEKEADLNLDTGAKILGDALGNAIGGAVEFAGEATAEIGKTIGTIAPGGIGKAIGKGIERIGKNTSEIGHDIRETTTEINQGSERSHDFTDREMERRESRSNERRGSERSK